MIPSAHQLRDARPFCSTIRFGSTTEAAFVSRSSRQVSWFHVRSDGRWVARLDIAVAEVYPHVVVLAALVDATSLIPRKKSGYSRPRLVAYGEVSPNCGRRHLAGGCVSAYSERGAYRRPDQRTLPICRASFRPIAQSLHTGNLLVLALPFATASRTNTVQLYSRTCGLVFPACWRLGTAAYSRTGRCNISFV